MALIKCPECGWEVSSFSQTCIKCGYPIQSRPVASHKKEFTGIYKYSLVNGKVEVYCPRCGSSNCSYHQQEKFIPGKTKTRYTMNLNPLRPFTLVNKKEKVVRKDKYVTEEKIRCNSCGHIFK